MSDGKARTTIALFVVVAAVCAAVATAGPASAKGVNGRWQLTPTTPGFVGETWEITDYCLLPPREMTPCTQVDVNTTNGPFRALGDPSGFTATRVHKNVIAHCADGSTEAGSADYQFTIDVATGTGGGTLTLFPTAACAGEPRTAPDLPMLVKTMNFTLTQTAQYQ